MENRAKVWGRYERLRPGQIEKIRNVSPVAFVPWGALEWHSYHNPIGLDGIVAEHLCMEVARRTGGVVLPPVYFATSTIKPLKGFAHSLEHSEKLIRQMATELMDQLIAEKFNVIVVLTGHCGQPHFDLLREAGRECAGAHPGVEIIVLTETDELADLADVNHAARGETSLQLFFAPETVDITLLPAGRAATLDDDGVWGDDPRQASAEEGERLAEAFAQRLAKRIDGLVEKSRE